MGIDPQNKILSLLLRQEARLGSDSLVIEECKREKNLFRG